MNITLLANKDVASCLALNYLLQGLQAHRLSVFLSSRVGSKPLPAELMKLKFIEQDLFNGLLFPLLARDPAPKGELLGFDQLAQLVEGRLGELNSINAADGLQRFAATEPELVLSIRYGVILREQALAIPARGVLNLHSGQLPDYKGVMATFWALLQGERELGTSLHFITDPGIDTGPVVARTTLPVDGQRSYLWHVLALYREGCATMLEAVNSLASGQQLQSTAQPGGGRYFSFPEVQDVQSFLEAGWRLWDPEDVLELGKRFQPDC